MKVKIFFYTFADLTFCTMMHTNIKILQMKRFIFTALVILGMLHWRCSNETFIDDGKKDKGEAQLGLTFPTSRGFGDSDGNEELLEKVRLIVFTSNSAGIEIGTPIINKVYPPLATDPIDEITINEIVPTGYLNLYLIGNEQASMNLDAVTNSTMLNSRIVDYTSAASTPGGAFVSPPFVMYSAYKAVSISATGAISHPQVITIGGKTTFPIERTAAKLTVHLNCDFVNLGNNPIAIDSAIIISMPLTSNLIPQEYTGSFYFSTKLLDLTSYIVSKPSGTGFETVKPPAGDGFTFYLPEHLINRTDRSHFTYLRLVGHLVSIPYPTKLIYRIPLGNGLTTNTAAHLLRNFATVPAADLTVTRNVHYKLNLDIRGLGELSDVEVWAEVAPWKTKWIAGPIDAPYLHVSTVSARVDGFNSQRIYFWANRADSIYIETIGKINTTGGSNFVVNNTFKTVAGHTPWPTNFTYNPATGIGYFDLILNTANTITPERYLIYLKSGQLRREIEVFVDYVGPPLWSNTPWVGAFWRASEVGERVIYGGHAGAWTAAVENPTTTGSFVVLDVTTGVLDPDFYTATPGNAEDYPVTNGVKTVSGTGNIVFRIGLTDRLSLPTSPPRYARVVVTHSGGTSYIYIRQGENADIVSAVPPYNYVEWSPYNVGNSNDPNLYGNGGFVDFPTKAGYFYQWSYGSGTVRPSPYNPCNPLTPAIWDVTANANCALTVVCPPGFKVPTGDVSGQQASIFSNTTSPVNGILNVRGYYADGFFDRRRIENAPGTSSSANSAVSVGNDNIAYLGRLVYSPTSLRCLFLPDAGIRLNNGGALFFAGAYNFYWSSTFTSIGGGVANAYLSQGDTPTSIGSQFQNATNGYPIRCVKSTISTASDFVWLSPSFTSSTPSTNNAIKTISVTSTGPIVLDGSQPANATVSISGSNVTITRSTTVFGLSSFKLKNSTTGEVITITVDNYYIDPNEEFLIPNSQLIGNTVDCEIYVEGGSENWVYVSQSDTWFTYSVAPDGKLRLTANQSPGTNPRSATITLAHANDPDYQVTFPVEQDLYTNTPPFEYFVLKFTWPSGGDVDIAVEFSGNKYVSGPYTGQPLPFDNDNTYGNQTQYSKALGFGLASHIFVDRNRTDGNRGSINDSGINAPLGTVGAFAIPNYNLWDTGNPGHPDNPIMQKGLMFFGGDAGDGQGETVFFNAKQVTPPSRKQDNTGWDRYLYLYVYAGRQPKPVTLEVSTYEGGIMVKPSGHGSGQYAPNHTSVNPPINDLNFYCVKETTPPTPPIVGNDLWGPNPLTPSTTQSQINALLNAPNWTQTKTVSATGTGAVQTFRSPSSMTLVATIIYDRYQRTATIL